MTERSATPLCGHFMAAKAISSTAGESCLLCVRRIYRLLVGAKIITMLCMRTEGTSLNERLSFRIDASDKALLRRAAALTDTDVTGFTLRNALKEARRVVAQNDRVELSELDSLRVLDLLDNPPAPNERLLRAARSLPATQ